MPYLTAKAAAEFLQLQAYEQLRIITEQKYPKREPNVYRAPFYQPALRAITTFYRKSNSPAVILQARIDCAELRPHSKKVNNERVLDAFEGSAQYTRRLAIRPVKKFELAIGNCVIVRLAADVLAHEDRNPRVLFYNFRTIALPLELARTTIEIAHWILEANGAEMPIASIEYIDFVEQRVHRIRNRRSKTIRRLKRNSQVISALWDAA